MHLTPHERDRLTLFTVAELARRRRGRGRRLNVPEAIALIADEMLERAWDGECLADIIAAARSLLTEDDVMDGVAALVRHVEIDCLFPSGTALVAVDDPIQPAAAHTAGRPGPGQVLAAAAPALPLSSGRARVRLAVVNESDTVVFVSSHYHFRDVNSALRFDRERARGMHLDLPAGSALAWAPQQRRTVELVAFGGTGPPDG